MTETTEQTKDQPAEPQSAVSLVIPCKAEYVALCRLVAGALGASEGLDEEFIADMKVVVTEACNCFLVEPEGCTQVEPETVTGRGTAEAVTGHGAAEPSPSLRVDFFPRIEAWEIIVSNPDCRRRISRARVCDPMSEGGLALTIIRALVATVELTDNEAEGSILRLVKSVGPETGSTD